MAATKQILVTTKTFEILKQKAKKLKKETGIPHHKALEKIALDSGLNNWKKVCLGNEPYKLSEEAYKNGAILAMDIKDGMESMGIKDVDLVEDSTVIADVIRADVYLNFINSINEDDPQKRNIKESMSEIEINEWFKEYINGFLFFRINKNSLSMKQVLGISNRYFFFPPEFIFINGQYLNTYDFPATNESGKVVGLRF